LVLTKFVVNPIIDFMKYLSVIAFAFSLSFFYQCQKKPDDPAIKEHHQEVLEWRKQKDEDYKDIDKTMLTPELMKDFKGLKYYPIDYNYVVTGSLWKDPQPKEITIHTSTGSSYQNLVYGTISFELHGEELKLHLYQSEKAAKEGRTKRALFLPFTDLTSGEETFGGGRYLVLDVPEGDELVLDFNMAYNPYCVYDPEHSCPVPPAVNRLEVKVGAGEKMYP